MTDVDVVVVGGGIAGLCAVVEASEAGASVLLVDSEAQVGGATRLAQGVVLGAGTRFQRERGIEDRPEDFYAEYMTLNRWTIQPSVAWRFCSEAGVLVEWLADRGVAVVDVAYAGEERAPRGHVTEGGEAIVATLWRAARAAGVDVGVGLRVDRLVVEDGRVAGVVAQGDEVRAGAVVLATGGFGANAEALAGEMACGLWDAEGEAHFAGPASSRGDALALGRQVGAQVCGSNRASRSPVGPLGAAYLPRCALVVNQLGRRFFPEGMSYAVLQDLLAREPGAVAYVILDDETKRSLTSIEQVRALKKVCLPGTEGGLVAWTDRGIDDLVARGEVVRATSVEQLGRALDVPAGPLAGTLDRYNALVAQGHDADYLKDPDGLRPVATPPFYAAPIRLSTFSYTNVGLRIDHDARVIDEANRAVPGLFAAGECAGGVVGDIYGGSGNSLAASGTFGRVAGRTAASEARRSAG